jgi:hypothetical protein
MANWSKWQDISSAKNLALQLAKVPGVYRIRLSNSSGRPIPIGRLLRIDKNGLLAIGESANLARRIKEFYQAYTAEKFGHHSVGDRLFLVLMCQYSRFKTNHQNNSGLQLQVMKLSSKADAQAEEEKLLKIYFKVHGELPPLNNSMPDKNSWHEIVKM